MSDNCPKCNDYGGNWPLGQPNPTRTWSRGQGNCNQLNINRFGMFQLDMRRKAETLLHSNNSSNWTKKERFSYLARNPNKILCTQATMKFNPASSSDVPGKATLFNDIDVPLTNWKNQLVQTNAGGENIPVDKIDCIQCKNLEAPILVADASTVYTGDTIVITITNYDYEAIYTWYKGDSIIVPDHLEENIDAGTLTATIVDSAEETNSGSYYVEVYEDDCRLSSNIVTIDVIPLTLGLLLQKIGIGGPGSGEQTDDKENQGQYLFGGAAQGFNMIAVDYKIFSVDSIHIASGFENIPVIQFNNISLYTQSESYSDTGPQNTYTVTFLPIAYTLDGWKTDGEKNSIFYDDNPTNDNNVIQGPEYILLTGVINSDFTPYIPSNNGKNVQSYNQGQIIVLDDAGQPSSGAWSNLGIVPRLVKWMRCFFINPDPDGSNYIDYVSMIRLAWGDEPSSINNDPDFISEFGPQQNINYPANQSDNPTLATNDSGDPDNLWPIILNQVDDGGEDDAYSDQIVYAAAEGFINYESGNPESSFTYRLGYSSVDMALDQFTTLDSEQKGYLVISKGKYSHKNQESWIIMPVWSLLAKTGFSLTADIIHSDAGGTDQARLSPQIISDIKYNTSTLFSSNITTPEDYTAEIKKSAYIAGQGPAPWTDTNTNEGTEIYIACIVLNVGNTSDEQPSYNDRNLSPIVPEYDGTDTSINEMNAAQTNVMTILTEATGANESIYYQRYIINPGDDGDPLLYTYTLGFDKTDGSFSVSKTGLLNAIFSNASCWFNPISFGSNNVNCLNSEVNQTQIIDKDYRNNNTIQGYKFSFNPDSSDKTLNISSGSGGALSEYYTQDNPYFPAPGYYTTQDFQTLDNSLYNLIDDTDFDLYGQNMGNSSKNYNIAHDIVGIESQRYEYIMKHYQNNDLINNDVINVRPYNERFKNGIYGFRVGKISPSNDSVAGTNFFSISSPDYDMDVGIYFVPIQWFVKSYDWDIHNIYNTNSDPYGTKYSTFSGKADGITYLVGVLVCNSLGGTIVVDGNMVFGKSTLPANPTETPKVQLSTLSQQLNWFTDYTGTVGRDELNWVNLYGPKYYITTYFNRIVMQYFGNCTLTLNFGNNTKTKGQVITAEAVSTQGQFLYRGPQIDIDDARALEDSGWLKYMDSNGNLIARNIGLFHCNIPTTGNGNVLTQAPAPISSEAYGSLIAVTYNGVNIPAGVEGQTNGVGGTAWVPYWSDPALENSIMGTEIFDSDDAYYQVQDGLGSIPGTSIFMEAMRGGPPTGTS